MPVISLFFGIIIRMYHNDHAPPHFHASYQGFEALIRIADGGVMAGSLPKKALRIVQDWADRPATNWTPIGSAVSICYPWK